MPMMVFVSEEVTMRPTRREALQAAVAAACALAVSPEASHAAEHTADAKEKPMQPLDYGRSFICNTAEFNSVRFWVESRTRIIDDENGTSTDYLQCGSCKSEHTFAEKDLFQEDNYDFLPIWGGRWLVFRRPVRLSDTYRTIYEPGQLWGEPVLKLREVPDARVLDTWDALRDATAAAVPLVTQTEIRDPDTKLRAVIECPVKTMNVDLNGKRYQTDTGPVAYPDLKKRHDPEIDCLSLAFIAFNAPGFADFVVEQPTPVSLDDPETCQVYHYSKPFSVAASNKLLALDKV
jgi:hypothetical protein